MRLWDYISDNKIILLVCFASSLFFSVILISFGVGVAEVFLLWVCFAIILFLTMLCSYLKQRNGATDHTYTVTGYGKLCFIINYR